MKNSIIIFGAVLIIAACNNKPNENKTPLEIPIVKTDTIVKVKKDTTMVKIPLSGDIGLNKLPPNIKAYVSNNFQGYVLKSAQYDPLCAGGDAIDVSITSKGKPAFSLIFLPDGTFVQKEEDVSIIKAPAKIREIAKNKFSDYQVATQIERLTLANKTVQYLLDLTKGKTAIEVIFNEDGSIDCQQKE